MYSIVTEIEMAELMLVLRKGKEGLVSDLVAPTEVDELDVGLGRGAK